MSGSAFGGATLGISMAPRRGVAVDLGCSVPVSVTGSYIGSVLHARSLAPNARRRDSLDVCSTLSPITEKKLQRTRKMSEAVLGSRLANLSAPENTVPVPVPRIARIPTVGEDITKDWIRVVINQYLLKHDLDMLRRDDAVVELDVVDCKTGVGDFSSTYRVDAVVESSTEQGLRREFHLVAKLLPPDDSGRACVFEANLFGKEIEVYFEVLPALRMFLRAQPGGDMSHVVDDSVPECVYGSHNTDGAGVIVFRSCTRLGFTQSADPDGLSADQLVTVVRALADLHATGKALLVKNTEETMRRRHSLLTQDLYANDTVLDECNHLLQIYADLLESGPDEEMLEPRESFRRLRSYGAWSMLRGLRRTGPPSLTTIIHGELWEKNLMFRPTDNKVMLLDWKNAKIASATLDLAFLVYSSASNALIVSSELDRVLVAYHEAYCARLGMLEPVAAAPTLDELQADFTLSSRDAILQAICMLVMEVQYLESRSVHRERVDAHEVNRLRAYERRAMNLLKGLDVAFNLPEDDDRRSDEEEEEDRHGGRERGQQHRGQPPRPENRPTRGMSIDEGSDAILFS